MSISKHIKKVGRGAKGAGDLSRPEAKDALDHILRGQASDLELGAFCLAMRIKAESSDELAGFLDAVEDGHLGKVHVTSDRPVLVLPSYNGARKTPNWVPLLALLLAREKIPVLIHGNEADEKRTTSMEIFQALGVTIATSIDDVTRELNRGAPVFAPLRVLSPELNRLLNVRQEIGLRNFG
ncbi:MAG TPA: DNA-binding protein YbiB, partial [Sedimentisphaerales bacterium]